MHCGVLLQRAPPRRLADRRERPAGTCEGANDVVALVGNQDLVPRLEELV